VLSGIDGVYGTGRMGITATFMNKLNLAGRRRAYACAMPFMAAAGHGHLGPRHAGGWPEIDSNRGGGVSRRCRGGRRRASGQGQQDRAGKHQ